MSITDVLPKVDVDLDLDSKCSLRYVMSNQDVCANPATWVWMLACCGNTKTVCDMHHKMGMEGISPFICRACRATDPDVLRAWRI